MSKPIIAAALALAFPAMLATAAPAAAATVPAFAPSAMAVETGADSGWNHGRDEYRRHDYGRHRGHYRERDYYGARGSYRRDYERRYERDRRGYDDGDYGCRRRTDGSGAIVGAILGGVVGNQVAGRGDRGAGTVIGAIGGAVIGNEVERGNSRCR